LKHYCNSNEVCAFAGYILTIPTVLVRWEKIPLDTYLHSFKLCMRMCGTDYKIAQQTVDISGLVNHLLITRQCLEMSTVCRDITIKFYASVPFKWFSVQRIWV